MSTFSPFTHQHLADFERDGYVIIKDFFTPEEANLIYQTSTEDKVINEKSFDFNDSQGLRTKLALWYTPQDDIYGLYSRSARMVEAAEMILDGTVGHYHSKLMQKEPKKGGAWEWHQDYGYWYNNGFLYPEMVSIMLALTEATKENGCMQVLKGTHRMGRVEHNITGEQVGAHMEKVEEAMKQHELVYVELQPGDALFFHCNLLHRSNANLSDHSRWSLISVYNKVTNKPYKDEPASCYTPIEKVTDDALLKSGKKGIASGADFLSKDKDTEFKEEIH
ncbi:phytanoyl-CoA dioxygenase family protein [Tunicatimonas pelagia]|uniref:phytanoyl-CoA dioxygenase family protein n=1 Tax=Tunicatimonas pelagia TaxID=931531 RepID=UPI0026652E0B|nr:phytanoyl-CoA dioxygenase family protein [Tunicatimonas pelagia]WKN42925.1 phytanoyl-CoA dioxygenase family protein [Tunicatimonas pelagia]